MDKLTTAQLAEYLDVTKRTIQRRAIRENWLFAEAKGLGGSRRLYSYATLPQNIRHQIAAAIIDKHEALSAFSAAKSKKQCTIALTPADFLQLLYGDAPAHPEAVDKNRLKLGVLALALLYVKSFQIGKIKGFEVFCKSYNKRQLGISPFVFTTINSISRITLLRWEKKAPLWCEAMTSTGGEQILDYDLARSLNTILKEVLLLNPTMTAERARQYLVFLFAKETIPDTPQIEQCIAAPKQQTEFKPRPVKLQNNGHRAAYWMNEDAFDDADHLVKGATAYYKPADMGGFKNYAAFSEHLMSLFVLIDEKKTEVAVAMYTAHALYGLAADAIAAFATIKGDLAAHEDHIQLLRVFQKNYIWPPVNKEDPNTMR